jgi:hypothetical protein
MRSESGHYLLRIIVSGNKIINVGKLLSNFQNKQLQNLGLEFDTLTVSPITKKDYNNNIESIDIDKLRILLAGEFHEKRNRYCHEKS